MNKKLSLSASVLASASLLFYTGCKKLEKEVLQPTPSPVQSTIKTSNEHGSVELSANTRIVSNELNKTLVAIDDASLTFNGESEFLNNIKPGNILVASISDVAVDGYLRTVIKIEKTANTYVVYTSQASLENVIVNGNIHVEQPLTFYSDENQKLSSVGTSTSKTIALNKVLYDRDGNLATMYDQLSTSGSLVLSATLFLDVTFSGSTLTYFKANTQFSANHTQSITGGGAFTVPAATKKLLASKLPAVSFTVGILPVTVRPNIEVFLDYEGTINASATFGYNGTVNVTPEIKFQNNKWTYGALRSITVAGNKPTINLDASLSATLRPRLNALLYGCTCASTYLQAETYVSLQASAFPVSKSLKAGIRGGAGANMFGYSPANNSLFNYFVVL
ncbi:MAG: hypothetical protein H7331_08810 [Bacteroidia bacterium]|nr:hypothetical protein [Bacteroidia bacterium]